jgi:hypothetical protein
MSASRSKKLRHDFWHCCRAADRDNLAVPQENYMTAYQIALDAHIAVGSVALATFWSAAAVRKGTQLHRRLGSAYVLAMIAVMLTALPLAAKAFASGQASLGIFLLYLILITATAIGIAWRAIRDRQSLARFLGPWYRPLAWTNLLAGGGVFSLGIAFHTPLLCGMSVIGLVVGRMMLRFAANPPSGRNWWLKRHYTAIVASGIATHIAFLNIGLQRVVPRDYSGAAFYAAWFGPVIVAVLALLWLDRRYGRGPDGARLAGSR